MKGKRPVMAISIAEEAHEPKKYEGSSEDWSADYHGARRQGKSVEQYEDSPRDRLADNAGERRFKGKDDPDEVKASGYKSGASAFTNHPKTSHGFGHGASHRDGHLRNSGHSGAHRIGRK